MSNKYKKWCAVGGCGKCVVLDPKKYRATYGKRDKSVRYTSKIYRCERCHKYQSLKQINIKFKRKDSTWFKRRTIKRRKIKRNKR